MMYVIGDSFSFGYNFYRDGVPNRKDNIYSSLLAKKLNMECQNISIPGGSNWRTARIIQSLPITQDDLVVIAWTESLRLELGVTKNQLYPNDTIINTSDIEDVELTKKFQQLGQPKFPFIDFVEKNNKVLTRRIFPALLDHPDQIKNHNFRNLAEKLYLQYGSTEWFEEMFLIMFSSTLHTLSNSGCKFIMFNTWSSPYSSYNKMFDIPEYFLGYNSNMSKFIRNNNNMDYWSKDEHVLVADILYNQLRKIYDIQ